MPFGFVLVRVRVRVRVCSSYQTGKAAFTPAMPKDSQHPSANTDLQLTQHEQHTRVKQVLFALCKGNSAQQPGMFSRTHYTKPRPKTDEAYGSLLIGSIQFNKTNACLCGLSYSLGASLINSKAPISVFFSYRHCAYTNAIAP